MSTFPSIVTTLTNPNATDRLNNPSHSSIHSAENSEITQIETFIGTLSSLQGTLLYDIRSSNSNGGGHVQTANKGGTGQTAYNQGDLLVGQSSSVLVKLASSGITGNVLTVDPSQAAGVKWSAVAANKVALNLSSVQFAGGQTSALQVLFATSVLGSTLSAGASIRFTGVIKNFGGSNQNYQIVVAYGNNTLESFNLIAKSSVVGTSGTITGIIAANGGFSSQLGYVTINTGNAVYATPGSPYGGVAYGTGTGSSSIEASANQNLIISGQSNATDTQSSITTGIFLVEKIL